MGALIEADALPYFPLSDRDRATQALIADREQAGNGSDRHAILVHERLRQLRDSQRCTIPGPLHETGVISAAEQINAGVIDQRGTERMRISDVENPTLQGGDR